MGNSLGLNKQKSNKTQYGKQMTQLANLIAEKPDTCTDTMETVLFTKITTAKVGSSKPSEIIPALQKLGQVWGYNISIESHFNATKRMLIRSIKNN